MYTTLFNAVTDAVELLEDRQFEAAHLKLIAVQQETEEIYMAGEDGSLSERPL